MRPVYQQRPRVGEAWVRTKAASKTWRVSCLIEPRKAADSSFVGLTMLWGTLLTAVAPNPVALTVRMWPEPSKAAHSVIDSSSVCGSTTCNNL